MKNQAICVLVLATILVACSSFTAAQLDTKQRKVDIPFAFHVQDKQLPAGTYLFGWVGPKLHIESTDGKYATWMNTVPFQTAEPIQQSVLLFTDYGTAIYLRQVKVCGRNIGHEVLRTRAENEIVNGNRRKTYAMVRVAMPR